MRKFIDEWRSDFRSGIPLTVWAILSVLVGLSGPFGTYQIMSLPVRVAFWSLLLGLAIAVGMAVRAFVFGNLGLRNFRYGSVLIAVLLAVIVPALVHLVLILPGFHFHIAVPALGEIALFSALCSLGVGAFRHAMGHFDPAVTTFAEPEAAPLAMAEPEPPRLLARLPDDRRGQIFWISVRDHYVDVGTSAGVSSLLLRLSDAIAETAGIDGGQVHRSHWVAWDAVRAAERQGSKLVLTMQDGTQIPVSKTYRALVEARGIGTS